MPYEQRRGCPAQPAVVSLQHRQRSRRRIAAVSFLSNISLDGTHRDTQMGRFTMLPSSADYSRSATLGSNIAKVSSSSCGTAKTRETNKKSSRTTRDYCQSNNEENSVVYLSDNNKHGREPLTQQFNEVTIANGNQVPSLSKVSTSSQEALINNKLRSNQSSYNSDCVEGGERSEKKKKSSGNDDNMEVNIIVNKTYNPNLNSNIGNLESHSRTNSKKLSSTIVKCATASQKVATRVRSMTQRTSLSRSSIGNSSSSITADLKVVKDGAKHRGKENVAHLAVDWDNIKDKVPGRRRKLSSTPLVTSCGSDKGFSSCESIGAITVSGRVRKASSSVSESSGSNTGTRDVKYVRVGPGWGGQVSGCTARQACEGRVLLTTGRGAPLHAFSLVRTSLPPRSGDVNTRKRNVSGSRHLATIADATDVLMDAPPLVAKLQQEASYSCLLVSSVHFTKTKKRLAADQAYDERLVLHHNHHPSHHHHHHNFNHPSAYHSQHVTNHHHHPVANQHVTNHHHHPVANQHALLGRCFSHDPSVSGQPPDVTTSQSQPPTSHSQSAIASIASGDPSGVGIGGVGTASQPIGAHLVRPNVAASAPFAYTNYSFAPELLDDPELRAGRHRKLLRFPSYMTSLIDYAKPAELKREVNDKFRGKFPHVKITLSKLRSLKREMVHICQSSVLGTSSPSVALLTVAHAHAYFDSLCLNGAVEKSSRKPLAGACVMISAKVNDVKGYVLEALIEKIGSQLRVEDSELLTAELTALLALKFSVHLPTVTVNMHYQRLLFEH